MQFELSDGVINDLIFAMENQHEDNVFDSQLLCVVKLETKSDNAADRYISIPEWTSIDGFKVMEHFVASLHSPSAKEALHDVLFAGKGVFRNFKNTLKEYPEAEQQWFTFKQRVLKEKIVQWYNVLRDSWGLEKIEGEPEETENLVFDDFTFREYDDLLDSRHITQVEKMALEGLEQTYSSDFSIIAQSMFEESKRMLDTSSSTTLCCTNIAGDFSGVISVSPIAPPAKHTVMLRLFFILPSFRGMGIGKELFMQCLQELKKRNYHWVIVPEIFIPETFTKVLLRSGFEKTPIGFMLNLVEAH